MHASPHESYFAPFSSPLQVFVSNIPYSFTEEDIVRTFDNLAITTVKVMRTNTGKSRGFCFIDFPSKDEQQRALQEIAQKQLDGRSVSVRVAKIEPERPAQEEVRFSLFLVFSSFWLVFPFLVCFPFLALR